MWLRGGLPSDLKGVRVLSYGYDTSLFQSQTFQSVDDIAIAFSKSIRSIRRNNQVGAPCLLFHWKLIWTEQIYTTTFNIHFS